MVETAAGLDGNLEYSTELFDAATIERFASQFKVLLAAAANNPDTHLSRLPLLSDEERQALLVLGKGPSEDSAAPSRTVVELFEAQVAAQPAAIAVDDACGSLTYAELNARANQLAHWLVGHGIRSEEPVGVFLERGSEAIVAMFGIWKAGGVYVPLDPEYPAARIEMMVADSGLEVLLTNSSLVDRLPSRQSEVALCLDQLSASLESLPIDSPRVNIRPTELAYIIYTSGSTGRPKGVLLEHGGLGRSHGHDDRRILSGCREPDVAIRLAKLRRLDR
jgi:non-ribosomal peptide synthetase component F